jgi:cytochrome P450
MSSTHEPALDAAKCPFSSGNGGFLATASLTDPEISAHPNDYYAAMRNQDPVHYDEKLKMYLVSRYEDIQTVLRDHITYSMEEGYKEQYAKGFAAELKEVLIKEGGGFFPDAIMTDPPYHTRIRRLMEGAFSAHRVKQLETEIEAMAAELLDQLADKGQMDAYTEFAIPMTGAIICAQLGLKNLPTETIRRWSHAVTQQIGRMQNREQMLEHAHQICELQNYLIERIHEREAHRTEDMISDLIYARSAEDGDAAALNFTETVSLVRALLIAGNETTATALTNLFYILGSQPDVAKKLQESVDDDRLMTRFVEELLRIEPPVRGLSRMTTKEVELNGKTLPKGAHLLLVYGSGNDDETEFPCPRNFDMNRSNLGRHVAFGGGAHRCVGLALARMEIKVAARQIVKKLDNLKLAIKPEDIQYLPTVATHSIASLPVTYTRRV